MNFATFHFWSSLLGGLALAWVIVQVIRKISPAHKRVVEKSAFSFISLWLLYQESLVTLIAFLWVVLIGWFCLKNTPRSISRHTHWLWSGTIILQLAPLFYFKYWNFVLEGILGVELSEPHALIPMGLSFYTFQVISVCLDTKREELKTPSFIDYFNFASFFPQIVAGPIERRKDLLPQIENIRLAVTKESIEKALPWIVLGLFYKMVLADNLALLANESRINPENGYHVVAEIIMFSFRIYFDFSGYSFVALGLGALFGVTLTLNFKSPYWAISIQDFWRRWHITLSQWLRDYVYFGMGGSRRGIIWLNLLVTFLVSGVWHGAGWNFLIWGLAHGLGLIICNYVPKFRMPLVLSWLLTLGFVFFTWLFFYETDIGQLGVKTATLLDPRSYLDFSMASVTGFVASRATLVFVAAILFMAVLVLLLEGLSLKKGRPYLLLTSLPSVGLMALLIVLLAPVEPSTFIYFNF